MATDDHMYHYMAKRTPPWNHVKVGWFLPAHFAASLTIALVLTTWVNGRAFQRNDTDETPASVTPITQADVTTLVSAALIIVRLLAGSWLTITGWRLAFLFLELQGASLTQLDWIINYRLPPLFGSRYMSLMLCAWIIFFLVTPTQLAAPILTGAISWNPGIVLDEPKQVGINQPGRYNRPEDNQYDAYYWHNQGLNSRSYEVYASLGPASITSVENFNNPKSPIYRRQIPSLPRTIINSTIANTTLPYFKIESRLDWIKTKEDFEKDGQILKKVVEDRNFTLGIMGRNPFYEGTDEGRLTIVNTERWKPAASMDSGSDYIYPAPTAQSGSKLLAVAIKFGKGCDEPMGPSLGSIPQAYRYAVRSSGCFIFARFNYTAGAFTCENCTTVANGVVEAFPTGNWAAAPDPLTEEAIAMMPDVLFYMKIANVSSGSLYNNMDNYATGMLNVAYQASWNTLANFWSNGNTAPTTIRTPVSILFASVSTTRVWIWFGINTLLTLSGVVLGILQTQSRSKTVRNPQVSALLLDTTLLMQQEGTGLCDAIEWEKNAKNLRLRLIVSTDKEVPYQHPYLEAEGKGYFELQQIDTTGQAATERPSTSGHTPSRSSND